ncbi:MAG: endonuclease/exonuclease/phosphatase family protein [Rhodocyclaceae bacterium]|nr:endonuclease/exonuclease/phosphatase family protein [Rhodocyclaceae bacterium]
MARTTRVSFATFNLYNLNLPGAGVYSDRDGWTADEYARKVAWSAEMVRRLDASVWGFQELWSGEALAAVFAQAGAADRYRLLVPPGHAGGHIVCAAAVEHALLVGEPEWITDFPPQFRLEGGGDDPQTPDIAVHVHAFSRPVLRFRIRPRSRGQVITVYVAHLKSKAPAQLYREGWYRADPAFYADHAVALGSAVATIRRTAEAAALRMLLTAEMKGTDTPVVVLGDLNDSTHSNTLNILTGQPNYLMSGLDKGGSDTSLYTVGMLQQYRSFRDVYYTHIHQNVRESLDHILVSQEFYDNSRKRLWAFKGMDLFNDHLNEDNHKADGTSDHGIAKASFEYRPAQD